MPSGDLYEHVAFDMPVSQSDGQGGTIDGWQERFKCRAKYLYLRGSEAVQAARLEGRQPVVITVRLSGQARQVTTDWRVRDVREGSVFNIRAIERTPDRKWLEILAEGGVAV